MPESNRHAGCSEVLVAGHICLDIIPELRHPGFAPRPGALEVVGPAVVSLGGCVANTGISLKRLGANVRLAAKVGDDPFGTLVKRELQKAGDSCDGLLVSPGEATSYSVILNPPHEDRFIFHYAGANDTFGADDLEPALKRSGRLLHFGYPPLMKGMIAHDGVELERLLKRAKQGGWITSLDMAYPNPDLCTNWPALLQRVLPFVDIFLPSYEELACMMGMLGPERLCEGSKPIFEADWCDFQTLSSHAISLGVGIVAIKLGSRGLYCRTSDPLRLAPISPQFSSSEWWNRELWTSVFDVDVVGTTGAGDATVAGFLFGILKGLGPYEVCRVACAVGAHCIEAADATSGIPQYASVQQRMCAGWRQMPCPARQQPRQVTPGVFCGPQDGTPHPR